MESSQKIDKERDPVLTKVESVAIEVRREFEEQQIDKTTLSDLYQRYNPLDDISSFVTIAEEMFPNLNCGLAAVYLQERLKAKDDLIEAEIRRGEYLDNNHTFLLINKGGLGDIVVDITADQYGGPKVYVGSLALPWRLKENVQDQAVSEERIG